MELYSGLSSIAGAVDRLGAALGDQAAQREQYRQKLQFENDLLNAQDVIKQEYQRLNTFDPEQLVQYATDTTPGGDNANEFRAKILDVDLSSPMAQEKRLAYRKILDQYSPEFEKVFEAGKIEYYTPMVEKSARATMGDGIMDQAGIAQLAEQYAPSVGRKRATDIIYGLNKSRASQLLTGLALKTGSADFLVTGTGQRPADEAEAMAWDQINLAMSYMTDEERRKTYETSRDTILQLKADENKAKIEAFTQYDMAFQSYINARDLRTARKSYNDAISQGIFYDEQKMQEWGNELKGLEKELSELADMSPQQKKAKEEASEKEYKNILARIAGPRLDYPDAMAESDILAMFQSGLLTSEHYTKAKDALKNRGEGNTTLDSMYKTAESMLAQQFPIVSPTNPDGKTFDKGLTEKAIAEAKAYIYEQFRIHQTKMKEAGLSEISKPEVQARIIKEAVSKAKTTSAEVKQKTSALKQATSNSTYEQIQSSPQLKDINALAETGALAAGIWSQDKAMIELFQAKADADQLGLASKLTPYRKMFANGVVVPVSVDPDLTIQKDGRPLLSYRLNFKTGFEEPDGTIIIKDLGGNPSIYNRAKGKWEPIAVLIPGFR